MSNIAIDVEQLSKRYRIGAVGESQDTLIGAVGEMVKRPLRNLRRLRSLSNFDESENEGNTIWALKDMSFQIRHGDAVGIIGDNGAGKSTLLKILSRITEPTSGRAIIRGRVSSLLEVGTGFHPELTGRENVYLNASVLGMSRRDVKREFDSIVAFSGVEKFIDTPLKRYSSGMKVRLAFAVAAHLEPEILIIDEVLAVGDVEFQRKCLGKMEAVAREGRTVLFVSHNMGAISNLCKSGMWLHNGELRMEGHPNQLVREYLKSSSVRSDADPSSWGRSKGTGEEVAVQQIRVLDVEGHPCDAFPMGESVVVEFDVRFARPFGVLDMSIDILRADLGMKVLHLLNHDVGFVPQVDRPAVTRFRVEIPRCSLYPGLYNLSLWIATPNKCLDHVQNVAQFSMVQSSLSQRTTPFYGHLGVYHTEAIWHEVPAPDDDEQLSRSSVSASGT